MSEELVQALATVEAAGYVAIRAKSYAAAQTRLAIAKCQLESEKQFNEGTRYWAHQAFEEQRRLGDRLTFVYGIAHAHGATVEELRGPDTTPNEEKR